MAAAVATAATAATATTAVARPSPSSESESESAAAGEPVLLETLVALRLERVFEHVLQEPRRDPLERARYRVRMARAEVVAASRGESADGAAGAVDPAELRTLVDRLMAASADLIEAFPDHPAAGEWRLDLAEDAWRWLWSLEAAGLQLHLGMPEAVVGRRAVRGAELVAREVPLAAAQLEFAIEQLEFSPGWPGDPAVVREHRRLVEEQRDGRLRVLRRIAAALGALHPPRSADTGPRAGAGDPASGGPGVQAAVDAVRDFAAERPAADELTVAMRQLEGLLLLRGRQSAAAAAAFDQAIAAAEELGDAFAAELSEIAADHCRARQPLAADGAVAAMGRLQRRAATAEEPGFLELFAADAAFRAGTAVLRAEDGPADLPPAAAEQRWRDGIAAWSRLAEHDPRWFAFIRGRFAASLEPGDPAEALPPVATLGRADAMLRDGRTAPALATLGRLATDENALASIHAEAWRTIARGAAAAGDVATAARAMLAASIHEPDAATARAGLDAGLRLAASIEPAVAGAAGDAGDDTDPLKDRWPAAVDPVRGEDPLLAGVRLAAQRDPDLPELDRWRSIAAARLITSGRDRDAARLLEAVSRDGAESSSALVMQVAIAHERLREVQATGDAATVVAAATDLRRRLDEARTILAAGRDADGRLAARLAGGRGSLLAAEADLAVGRGLDALACLGLPPGQAAAAGFGPAISAADPVVADAAADLAVRAILAAFTAGPGESADAGRLRAVIEQAATASPRAATALVRELARRVEASATAVRVADPDGDPTRTIHAAPLPEDPTDPLVLLATGLEAWLAATSDSSAAPPAVLAIARRELGRLAIAAGRFAEARAWFDAVGGLQSADPGVLLGAADARVLATEADSDAEELAAAMAAYRRLVAGREAAGPVRWWTAQLRMLQILDRTGRNTEAIGPRIERLRLDDPTFGDPRLRAAFESLAARHAAPPSP